METKIFKLFPVNPMKTQKHDLFKTYRGITFFIYIDREGNNLVFSNTFWRDFFSNILLQLHWTQQHCVTWESATASLKKLGRQQGPRQRAFRKRPGWHFAPFPWHWHSALLSPGPASPATTTPIHTQTLLHFLSSLNWMTLRCCSKFWHIFYHTCFAVSVCNQNFL